MPEAGNSEASLIALGVVLGAVLIVVILCVVFCLCFRRKMCARSRYLGNTTLARSDEEYTLPNGKGSGTTSIDSLTSEPLKVKPAPALVLYFHESQEYVDLNRKLVTWMRSVVGAENVTDMSEESLAETLSQEQESFVVSKLDGAKSGRTRVLVLNSPTAVQAMRSTGSEDVPLATSDLDQFYELKVFALNRVKSLYTGNYKQVLVAGYSGLRPTGSDIEDITPLKKQVLLPEQLSLVQSWLAGTPGPLAANPSEVEELEQEYVRAARSFLELASTSSDEQRGDSPNVLTV